MIEARIPAVVWCLGRRDRWPLYFATITCVAYFGRVAFNVMSVIPKRTDFYYFWVAGKIWSQGGSPYSPIFGNVWTSAVSNMIAGIWIYPPTWYPICRLLSAFPLGFASKIWTALILLSLVGSIIAWCAYRAIGGPLSQFWFTVLFLVTIAAEPTFRSMRNGQTGVFISFGVGLLLFGALRRNMICAALGAYLVMLKPTFGIPLCVAFVLMPGMWRPIVIAGAATVASMLPAFQTETMADMLDGIARNIDTYRSARYNSPVALLGFFHFVNRIWNYQPSVVVMFLAGIVPILAAFCCLRLRNASSEDTIISLFVVGLASTVFFNLPHRYDLVCVYILAIVIWHFRPWLVIGLCVLPIVAFRTFNVNYLSLAAGITWCAAMATAMLPRTYTNRLSLGLMILSPLRRPQINLPLRD